MTDSKPYLSVVIPCFNEREYVRNTVEKTFAAFDERVEVIVVDDGSKDGSYDELRDAAKRFPDLRVIRHDRNKGKGAAIRTGVEAASGDIIGFVDGDGEVNPDYLMEAAAIIRESDLTDIVIGNRYLIPDGYKTTAIRKLYSRVYQCMNWLLFSLPWKDTQAGLKAFRGRIAKELFAASDIHGYAFDIDILAHAHLRGLRVEELPITQVLKGGSTISKRHIFQMIVDTVGTYLHFAKEEWAFFRKQGNPVRLFAFLGRQILALPTAFAAWICAKVGLFVLVKMNKQ